MLTNFRRKYKLRIFNKKNFPLVISTFLLSVSLLAINHTTYASEDIHFSKFTDINNAFWAKDEVTQLVEMGVINGYPDFQFRPSVNVNRGQAANLLTSALELPQVEYQPIFSDVSENSSYLRGVMSTYNAEIFNGKPDGTFGTADILTREQMASVIVRAFKLEDTGEEIEFTDWNRISESHRYGVKVLAQHNITTGKEDGSFDPKTPVNRATYVVFLHRALEATKQIEAIKNISFEEPTLSKNYLPIRENRFFTELPLEDGGVKTYIRSKEVLRYMGKSTLQYAYAEDTIYSYRISGTSAFLKITKRTFKNGDFFLFTELKNSSSMLIQIDIIRTQGDIQQLKVHRYDRYPIAKNEDDTFGYDPTTYPTGIVEKKSNEGIISQEMIGQAYRSKDLTLVYNTGAVSKTRELLDETEAFSSALIKDNHMSIYTLVSFRYDVVDHWMMDSDQQLFKEITNMESWMLESAVNYRKRNSWYTAGGPYNKMATTVEPMPISFKGYGRNLLLVKEDRAFDLYMQNKEPYFQNLLVNSFVNLQNFKGKKTYWETEVTSTYLKHLYDITAPFIDTRFNEQIALFLFKSGKEFGNPDFQIPLRNYADLLISQKSKGNIIPVDSNSYYIADYFPLVQDVTTHSSMNHVLGGMNILLIAYNELGDKKYLDAATKIQTAIEKEKNLWLRPDGDIWYRVSPEKDFAGRDYSHLTLEDLINSYKLWKNIDPSHVPTIEELMRSKAGYLSKNNLGYTTKIKLGLEEINMSEILPKGPEHTDAE